MMIAFAVLHSPQPFHGQEHHCIDQTHGGLACCYPCCRKSLAWNRPTVVTGAPELHLPAVVESVYVLPRAFACSVSHECHNAQRKWLQYVKCFMAVTARYLSVEMPISLDNRKPRESTKLLQPMRSQLTSLLDGTVQLVCCADGLPQGLIGCCSPSADTLKAAIVV